jgi:hypothetical protein
MATFSSDSGIEERPVIVDPPFGFDLLDIPREVPITGCYPFILVYFSRGSHWSPWTATDISALKQASAHIDISTLSRDCELLATATPDADPGGRYTLLFYHVQPNRQHPLWIDY